MTELRKYRIETDHDYGVFEGVDALAAWQALGTDMGYDKNSDPSVFSWATIPDHVSIKLVVSTEEESVR